MLLAKVIEPDKTRQSEYVESDKNVQSEHVAEGSSSSESEELGKPQSFVDSLVIGSKQGVILVVNIAALLITIGAILSVINFLLTTVVGTDLSAIFGWLLRPVAWVIGVEWGDCKSVGALMGTEIVATEFIAFSQLADKLDVREQAPSLSLRTTTLAIYALCGFASLPSIAVQIGALSAIAPGKKSEIIRLAPRAMIAGLLASWLTAAVVGVFTFPVKYQDGDTLRIGYSAERPFAFTDDGEAKGLSLELAQKIAENLNGDSRKVEIVYVEKFGELIARLESGDFDVIATGMFITDARSRVVIFSEATLEVERGFLGKGRVPESYDEILQEKLRIGVVRGGVSEQDANNAKVQSSRLKVFESIAAAVEALKKGEIDVIAGSVVSLEALVPKHYRVEPLTAGTRRSMKAAFVFREEDKELRDSFNKRLQNEEVLEFQEKLLKDSDLKGLKGLRQIRDESPNVKEKEN